MNDGQYNKFIKDQLQNNEESYFADIEHNKDLVWNNIERRLKKKKVIPFWIYSAAAMIFILIAFGFIAKQQIEKRNSEISELKARLEKQQMKWSEYEMANCNTLIQFDTLKIVQQKMVYQPLHNFDTIVMYDTINKIVVLTDTVLINLNEHELIADNEPLKVEKISENTDFAANQEPKKNKKNKRIIFRFGKQNDQTPMNENAMNESKSLISLQSK